VLNYNSFVDLEIIFMEELKEFNIARSDMLSMDQEAQRDGIFKRKHNEDEDEEEYLLRKNLVSTKNIIEKIQKGLNIIEHMKAMIFGADKNA